MNQLHVPIIVHFPACNCILENKFTLSQQKNTNHSSSGIQIADDKQEIKISVTTIARD
jgi:hypothetical protein